MHRAVLAVAGLTTTGLLAFGGVALAADATPASNPCHSALVKVRNDARQAAKDSAALATAKKVSAADQAAVEQAAQQLATDSAAASPDQSKIATDTTNFQKATAQLAADAAAVGDNGPLATAFKADLAKLNTDVATEQGVCNPPAPPTTTTDAPAPTSTTVAPAATTTAAPAPTTTAATTTASDSTGSMNSGSTIPGTPPVSVPITVGAPAGGSGAQVSVVPSGVNTGRA